MKTERESMIEILLRQLNRLEKIAQALQCTDVGEYLEKQCDITAAMCSLAAYLKVGLMEFDGSEDY